MTDAAAERVQVLDLKSEAEAHALFDEAFAERAPRREVVPLEAALGRMVADDVRAPGDVPAFDRADRDGFAVRAEDTFGADELHPVALVRRGPDRAAGRVRTSDALEVGPGEAARIATGAVLPRGADAVVMVEDVHTVEGAPTLALHAAVVPGAHVTFAGTDLARDEIVVRRGVRLGSHQTALLAAAGVGAISVWARPRVAIASTGNEVVPPGGRLELGQVHDANLRAIADALREAGAEPSEGGIIPDDVDAVIDFVRRALVDPTIDLVVLSGGTSKGRGDVNARALEALARDLPDSRGILLHGVALKPGKPLCLAHLAGRPVVVLPGFPTSALFTFRELGAPRVRRLAGERAPRPVTLPAKAAVRLDAAPGRTTYALVRLVRGEAGLAAYPLRGGSGSISTLARADGYVRLAATDEFLPAGSPVDVRAIGATIDPPDLVAIGSHCTGLDALLSELESRGFSTTSIAVGSRGGLAALTRGEGEVAGIHLLCPDTDRFNAPFVPAGCHLLPGYTRRQGFAFRRDDERFAAATSPAAVRAAIAAAGCRMVNRNAGSGTRLLLDAFLDLPRDAPRPGGYLVQARTHHAVTAAIAQGRADWGLTLEGLAREAGLGFVFYREERYDLVVRARAWDRPAVRELRSLLAEPRVHALLAALGFRIGTEHQESS